MNTKQLLPAILVLMFASQPAVVQAEASHRIGPLCTTKNIAPPPKKPVIPVKLVDKESETHQPASSKPFFSNAERCLAQLKKQNRAKSPCTRFPDDGVLALNHKKRLFAFIERVGCTMAGCSGIRLLLLSFPKVKLIKLKKLYIPFEVTEAKLKELARKEKRKADDVFKTEHIAKRRHAARLAFWHWMAELKKEGFLPAIDRIASRTTSCQAVACHTPLARLGHPFSGAMLYIVKRNRRVQGRWVFPGNRRSEALFSMRFKRICVEKEGRKCKRLANRNQFSFKGAYVSWRARRMILWGDLHAGQHNPDTSLWLRVVALPNEFYYQARIDSGGRLHGDWISWHPNCKVKTRGRFKHGKPIGSWKSLDPQGKPVIPSKH